MASSFIYRPHVVEGETLVTPDILIDDVSVSVAGEALIRSPNDRLSMNTEIQTVGESCADGAVALIAAGAGMLIGLASIHRDRALDSALGFREGTKLLCRQAWRYKDMADHAGDLRLNVRASDNAILQDGTLLSMMDINRIEQIPSGAVMLYAGLPLLADASGSTVYELTLTDPVLDRDLNYRYSAAKIDEPAEARTRKRS